MKRIVVTIISCLMVITLIALPVLAAYSARIRVIETSNTSYTMMPMIVDVNNTYLVSEGYITGTGLDTRVESGGAGVPHLLTNDKVLFANGVSANTTANFDYTTGNVALPDFPVIVGYDGYVTIPDAALLECSDNFTVTHTGYIDTTAGADRNLIIKENSLRVFIGGTDNITAWITDVGAPLTETLRPTANGDVINITDMFPDGGEAHWEDVDEVVADEDVTYVFNNGSGVYERDIYEIADSAVGTGVINSITLWGRARRTGGAGGYQSAWKSNATEWQVIPDQQPLLVYLSVFKTYATNPITTNAWTWTEVDDLQVGANISQTAGTEYRVTQIWVIVNYSPVVQLQVSADGITPGTHTVVVEADGVNFWINVDGGAIEDTVALAGAACTDLPNAWVIMENNCIPYMDSLTIDVANVERLRYQPVTIISGTTLPDATGANTGTITWGANPAGLAVTIGGMVSDTQPAPAVGGTVIVTPDIAAPIEQPSNYFTGRDMSTNPMHALIHPLANMTGFNESWIWIICASTIIISGMVYCLAKFKSQLLAGIAGFALLIVFYSMGIYPYWVLIVYAIIAVAIVIMERVQSW